MNTFPRTEVLAIDTSMSAIPSDRFEPRPDSVALCSNSKSRISANEPFSCPRGFHIRSWIRRCRPCKLDQQAINEEASGSSRVYETFQADSRVTHSRFRHSQSNQTTDNHSHLLERVRRVVPRSLSIYFEVDHPRPDILQTSRLQ